jgi:hypothetical protein
MIGDLADPSGVSHKKYDVGDIFRMQAQVIDAAVGIQDEICVGNSVHLPVCTTFSIKIV